MLEVNGILNILIIYNEIFRRFDLKLAYKSSDSSSSLTEMAVSHKSYSPQISRIKRAEIFKPKRDALVPQESLISDEDTTLNEMMGKFDESYIYEKETDILR